MNNSKEKMRSTERELVLKIIDGQKAKNTLGNTDPRLFTGDNKLWAVQDTSSMLWSAKYTNGTIPAPLRQTFTSFNYLLREATNYFKNRNIAITKVID